LDLLRPEISKIKILAEFCRELQNVIFTTLAVGPRVHFIRLEKKPLVILRAVLAETK
jgi:hypothetical protein